ncbi:MAG TPA: hypothetical protein VL463_16385 [Kofleriaceae bacterium]|nr:hypothetical protein [Kofleriaceae bacterium]
MTYRDDLDAAHARNADLERQVLALEKRSLGIEPKRKSGVVPLVAILAGLGLSLGAVLGGLGWIVTVSGVLVALVAAGALQPTSPPDGGPYPVRHEITAPCADRDVKILAIALVRIVPGPGGSAVFTIANRQRITETVREVVEGVVRLAIASRTEAELRASAELSSSVGERVANAVERYGLVVDSLYVSLLR